MNARRKTSPPAATAALLLLSYAGLVLGASDLPATADAAPYRVPEHRAQAPAGIGENFAQAYRALQEGQYDNARELYQKLLGDEPRQIDALLGLAAIAELQNQADLASLYYSRILAVEPRHALAQAGLLAQIGRNDPRRAAARLQQLLTRQPAAYLYFVLGNLYAEQELWYGAQQAYFHAHRLEPDNPDFAFNLGVGSEHLGQRQNALRYYRLALRLAQQEKRAHFDLAAAQARALQLEAPANP